MRGRLPLRLVVTLSLLLAIPAAAQLGASAAANTPSSKDQCKRGGWRTLADEHGNRFRNQGQCVSWAAHHPRPALGLSDLAGSFSFTGATSLTFAASGCVNIRQVFDVTYPASSAVGNAALHAEGCLSDVLTLYTGTFTITTNVGTISGTASGPIAFAAVIDFQLTLTVSSGTGAFRGTAGALHAELIWDGPPVTVVTGSVTAT